MSNENKSIKVQSHNGDSTPLATFHPDFSTGAMLRLNSPVELKYINPPNVISGFRVYSDAIEKIKPELKEFAEKYGIEKYQSLRESILTSLYDIGGNGELEKYTEEANKELAEIVQHFTTLMKSSLLEFVAEYKARETKIIDARINNAKRKIAKAMKTGEFDE